VLALDEVGVGDGRHYCERFVFVVDDRLGIMEMLTRLSARCLEKQLKAAFFLAIAISCMHHTTGCRSCNREPSQVFPLGGDGCGQKAAVKRRNWLT
jgi:hypothetical protein